MRFLSAFQPLLPCEDLRLPHFSRPFDLSHVVRIGDLDFPESNPPKCMQAKLRTTKHEGIWARKGRIWWRLTFLRTWRILMPFGMHQFSMHQLSINYFWQNRRRICLEICKKEMFLLIWKDEMSKRWAIANLGDLTSVWWFIKVSL